MIDPSATKPVLYSGGEASRIYEGEVIVRSWFHWPDGQPGEHDTAKMPYEDAMQWLAAAPFTPLIASDGAEAHEVRVERAIVIPWCHECGGPLDD